MPNDAGLQDKIASDTLPKYTKGVHIIVYNRPPTETDGHNAAWYPQE